MIFSFFPLSLSLFHFLVILIEHLIAVDQCSLSLADGLDGDALTPRGQILLQQLHAHRAVHA